MRQRHLLLTDKQESDLKTYLKRRLDDLRQDNKERIEADRQSLLDYENSKDYRAKIGTVFAQSNMSIPLTSWVVDYFGSRTEDEIFDRKPIASFGPEGPSNQDLARGLDRWANFKLFKLAKADVNMREGIPNIFLQRAKILKAIYDEDNDQWEERDISVLHDVSTDQPIRIPGHGMVLETDPWKETQDSITGNRVLALEADPTVIHDGAKYNFKPSKEPIRFKVVNYAGPRSIDVDSDCFLAPSSARSLDEADCIAESYDKPIWWVKDRFIDREWITYEDFQSKLKNQGAKKKTAGRRSDLGKESLDYDKDNASIGIVEFWIERDILGWGSRQRVVVWMEAKTGELIDYEYQRKVSPNGRHPYTAIAICKSQRTWWGRSMVEIIRPFQEYIDLQWNRHSFRNSINANPIVAQNPDAIQEKKNFLELAPFDVVNLEHGFSVGDWLQTFNFPKLDLDTQELIDKAIYWVNFWLGISNIAQGDYSNVPQNTTLGGQEATLREASKLSRRWTRRVSDGIADHLQKLTLIAIDSMDAQEVYTYLDGDNEQSAFIEASAIENLKIDVRLIVGRERSTQTIQENQLTLQIIEKYFSYPPQMQAAARPVLKASLWLLGHDNVDQMLPPTVPLDAATAEANQNGLDEAAFTREGGKSGEVGEAE